MKVLATLCFLIAFVGNLFGIRFNDVEQPDKYIKVDSNVYVKFKGEPKRYFYQTPLGDVTIFEYKPEEAVADSNCLYSVALYKAPSGEGSEGEQLKSAIDIRFNSLIDSEETGLNSLGGKILSKDEFIQENLRGIKYKILFTGLSEMNEIEGLKDVMYNVKYLKYNGTVIKMWVYTALNKENKTIEEFFNALKFSR